MVIDDGRTESPNERADRNMAELLQELRVALPGVQVLFAFLLAVPFQDGFEEVTTFQRDVYFATLLFSAVAIVLLIAPTPYHRLNFARGDKEHIVETAGRLAVLGLGALAIAMSGAVLLVTDWLFGTTVVVVTMAFIASMFVTAWFVLPLRRRGKTEPRS